MKLQKFVICLGCITPAVASASVIGGKYSTEWQWDMGSKTNWVNLLRFDLDLPVWEHGAVHAATIHIAKTGPAIIDDWQGFSNIYEENNVAAIAVLGYMNSWENAHLFAGVRNANEDFFTSECTSLFINSSCGIFPTISANYPIANYPVSGLTVYFDATFGNWTIKNSLYNGSGYNGWNRHDNPFLVRPKRDGMFDIAEVSYDYGQGRYFAGAAVHTKGKASCAWWLYGEQEIAGGLSLMAQYSENTDRRSSCRRYAEIGSIFTDNGNSFGLSGQYAGYDEGDEWSVELTWQRNLTKSISVQPSLQYIRSGERNFTVVCGRLCYSF